MQIFLLRCNDAFSRWCCLLSMQLSSSWRLWLEQVQGWWHWAHRRPRSGSLPSSSSGFHGGNRYWTNYHINKCRSTMAIYTVPVSTWNYEGLQWELWLCREKNPERSQNGTQVGMGKKRKKVTSIWPYYILSKKQDSERHWCCPWILNCVQSLISLPS